VEFRNQQEVLVLERYSILSRQAVMAARAEAGKLGSDAIDSEHLLMGIVCVHPNLFTSLGIEVELDSLRENAESSGLLHHPSRIRVICRYPRTRAGYCSRLPP
jgi:hypothetical protein